ncbi:MAG: cobalt transporter CbiM [Deltaproteobacteria bacterium]|nr:MAG: cobalt transporter CbiM [Deltaproteobacteria bacterium]
MHISEGILSGPVLGTGMAVAAIGTAVGLKRLDYDHIARAGVLSAAFFVASLVHVPIGPANVHLLLNGLVGLFLGWGAFPVILTALILQAVLFQFGGITTLGVNTAAMAVPAVIVRYAFGPLIWKRPPVAQAAAFACGFGAVLLGAVLVGLALIFTGQEFLEVTGIIMAAHLPVMVIEGVITLFAVAFLKKVQPALLPGYCARPVDDTPEGKNEIDTP